MFIQQNGYATCPIHIFFASRMAISSNEKINYKKTY